MNLDELLRSLTGFDWDTGNAEKSWEKHHVHRSEAEEVFFNHPLVVADDKKHSDKEKRYAALRITNFDRRLLVIFTIRKNTLIRVISVRDMSRKEKKIYEQIKKEKNS